MNRLTRICRAAGVGLAVATATLAMTQMAHAAPPQPDVPKDLVPDGVSQFLVAHAKGVQIYKCQSGTNGTFSWAFVEPRANLVGDNGQLIKHTKGPTWTAAADGSSVSRDPSRVVKSVSVTSPDRDIPWLLVPVAPAGSSNDPGDLLTGTTFIQRIHTQGGTTHPASERRVQGANGRQGEGGPLPGGLRLLQVEGRACSSASTCRMAAPRIVRERPFLLSPCRASPRRSRPDSIE